MVMSVGVLPAHLDRIVQVPVSVKMEALVWRMAFVPAQMDGLDMTVHIKFHVHWVAYTI
jgi:hypothetical protein